MIAILAVLGFIVGLLIDGLAQISQGWVGGPILAVCAVVGGLVGALVEAAHNSRNAK